MASTASFTDTLASGISASWYNWGGASFTSSGLGFKATSGTAATNTGVNTVSYYDLTGSFCSVRLNSAGNQSIASWEVFSCTLIKDANNSVSVRVTDGIIQARTVIAGTAANHAGVTYSATTHAWVRIREASGTMYWDFSANGTSWTNLYSVANPFAITAVEMQLSADNYATETLTTSAIWSNLNLPPAVVSATAGSATVGVTAHGATAFAPANAGSAQVGVTAHGAQGFMQPPPILRSTFLMPSINAQYPNITWTQAQFEAEFQWMTSAGIHEIILQWTVDQDANETYFTYSGGTLPPEYNNMVGTCLAAAAACGVKVWLGLCNTANWQANANNSTWLNAQYALNQAAATQIMSLFSGQFVGWYISNEWSDTLYLDGSAYITASTAFFQSNTSWLHANTGLPVMTSPANYGGQSASAFAANIAAVCGSFDVINVQDGTGDVGFTASQVTSYFTALAAQFSGKPGVQLWQNADLYGYGTGLPITIANLSANLAATVGLVSKYSSFSFETQMDPLTTSPAGNYSYYQAYRAYAKPYFDASDFTATPGTAVVGAAGRAPSPAVKPTAGVATVGVTPRAPIASIGAMAGTAVIGGSAPSMGAGVAPTGRVATVGVSTPTAMTTITLSVHPAAALIGVAAIPPPSDLGSASIGVQVFNATVVAFAPAAERTYVIPFEDRTYVIPAEDRTAPIAAEDRTMVVDPEDRTVQIPFEDRTDVVTED